MTKNPLLNALSAALYIVVVASVMYYVPDRVETIIPVLGIMSFLSLFVLSVAVMGLLFLYQPLQLYLQGKNAEALRLGLQTPAYFAIVTIIFLSVVFFISAS